MKVEMTGDIDPFPLPEHVREMVGATVLFTELEPSEEVPEPEVIRGIVTGARWFRNADGIPVGMGRAVQLMIDRGDGTMRWIGPFGV